MINQSSVEISVVVPVFQSEGTLRELHRRLSEVFDELDVTYEIILVDDGSTDDSWEMICALADSDSNVRGVELSRNFGQNPAISAGLEEATGNWVVVMDCDLQDRPEEIKNFYTLARSGFDQVVGLRVARNDSFLKRAFSSLYLKVLRASTGLRVARGVGNFGIYSQDVIKGVRSMGERSRIFGLAILWVGFRRAEIEIQHDPRTVGKSSYTLKRLFNLAVDGILCSSDRPLRAVLAVGVGIGCLNGIALVVLLVRGLIAGATPAGWLSIVLSMGTSFGVLIAVVGIVGLYIGRIYDEVKERPRYLVRTNLLTRRMK